MSELVARRTFSGQVELDASIMDGRTLAAGAVGAVKHYPNPIEIARKVMELTPHVLLVGEGASCSQNAMVLASPNY